MPGNIEQRLEELNTYKESIRIALASESLYDYVKYTNRGYVDNAFGKDVCDRVEKFVFDHQIYNYMRIMILIAPPQHGKSKNITESLPAFYLGRKPDNKVIGLSYGDELARRFGLSNLNKVGNYGKLIFNEELDTKKPCTALEFHIAGKNGQYLSRGLTSGVTGNPGDLVIIDDPVRGREDADSENFRNKCWDGYLANIKTRVSANAKILIILTRWHEDDLAGRIEAYGNAMGNVSVLRYPCECETLDDPMHRKIGEPLCPELGKGKEWLNATKTDYLNDPTQGGKRTWEALFQGRPKALEGNLVQAVWFKFWKPKGMKLPPVKLRISGGEFVEIEAEDLPDRMDKEIQAWDCTFKDSKRSDYVCGGEWGRNKANYYLLDCFHKQANFTDTIAAIEEMSRKHPKSIAKYIEDKANGSAVITSLKSKISGIIGVEASDDKIARLNAVTPVFKSGNVYFPHPQYLPFTLELIEELLAFPNGSHDDYVDMCSHALNQLMYETNDTEARTIKPGTYAYPVLKERGYSDIEIRKAYMSGDIKLYCIPDKYKKWVSRR